MMNVVNKRKFSLIGAAGYVAPKHLKAIKNNNGILKAALDPNDSVGVLDRYFPETHFFKNFERFERYIVKQRDIDPIDYISICSPNHHHDSHCRLALQNACHAICEKPLVLNPWNLDILKKYEAKTGKQIFNILQLRLHPEIIKLKEKVDANPDQQFEIDLTYITSRGPWYHISWKGDRSKSGGITSNIGIHFFDMLLWIFGGVNKNLIHCYEDKFAAGYLELDRARIKWFLSVDSLHLPESSRKDFQSTYRSLTVNDEKIDFTNGFEDLHDESYHQILKGNGFTTNDVTQVIQLGTDLRTNQPIGLKGDYHPILNRVI